MLTFILILFSFWCFFKIADLIAKTGENNTKTTHKNEEETGVSLNSIVNENGISYQARKVQVVGVSYSNNTGPSRQTCIARLKSCDDVWLEAEPDNKYDKNAIKVMSVHGQLGYLPKAIAATISSSLLNSIVVEFLSKGTSNKNYWGCSVTLKIPLTPSETPSPQRVKKQSTGFNKEASIQAAMKNLLNNHQLHQILDNSSRLNLSEKEASIFREALSNASPAPSAPPSKIDRPAPPMDFNYYYDESYYYEDPYESDPKYKDEYTRNPR
ncbi:HIRAN domain-containing protein [Motilimonas pumila]|uniref:HIRAN domain-containing protein n=1 Tax=Motilimonas pumila TaxID=2303987 RepID=A0A418YA45_9GAMM|nr:HIRAN domain-containing protein [Motilimonas pumila]RJG38973.1 hypothetical protein D1Z90_18545 [Motilimonas pumila]